MSLFYHWKMNKNSKFNIRCDLIILDLGLGFRYGFFSYFHILVKLGLT
jgi:hypothetical protein